MASLGTMGTEASMSARIEMASLLVAAFCAGFLLQAQPAAQDVAPHFTISGTSTVRAWSCPAQGVSKITPGKSSPPVPVFPHCVQTVAVTVAVKAIECEDKEMNDHLREALKEKLYPAIVYQLEQYTLTGNNAAKTTGKLTITGVTRPVSFEVKLSPSPQGVRAVGETSIDMTQFKVTPPDLWLGMLKVGKDVRVRFDAVLQPSQ
jgi:hypothetical protein